MRKPFTIMDPDEEAEQLAKEIYELIWQGEEDNKARAIYTTLVNGTPRAGTIYYHGSDEYFDLVSKTLGEKMTAISTAVYNLFCFMGATGTRYCLHVFQDTPCPIQLQNTIGGPNRCRFEHDKHHRLLRDEKIMAQLKINFARIEELIAKVRESTERKNLLNEPPPPPYSSVDIKDLKALAKEEKRQTEMVAILEKRYLFAEDQNHYNTTECPVVARTIIPHDATREAFDAYLTAITTCGSKEEHKYCYTALKGNKCHIHGCKRIHHLPQSLYLQKFAHLRPKLLYYINTYPIRLDAYRRDPLKFTSEAHYPIHQETELPATRTVPLRKNPELRESFRAEKRKLRHYEEDYLNYMQSPARSEPDEYEFSRKRNRDRSEPAEYEYDRNERRNYEFDRRYEKEKEEEENEPEYYQSTNGEYYWDNREEEQQPYFYPHRERTDYPTRFTIRNEFYTSPPRRGRDHYSPTRITHPTPRYNRSPSRYSHSQPPRYNRPPPPRYNHSPPLPHKIYTTTTTTTTRDSPEPPLRDRYSSYTQRTSTDHTPLRNEDKGFLNTTFNVSRNEPKRTEETTKPVEKNNNSTARNVRNTRMIDENGTTIRETLAVNFTKEIRYNVHAERKRSPY